MRTEGMGPSMSRREHPTVRSIAGAVEGGGGLFSLEMEMMRCSVPSLLVLVLTQPAHVPPLVLCPCTFPLCSAVAPIPCGHRVQPLCEV